jgi:hypothetical protein
MAVVLLKNLRPGMVVAGDVEVLKQAQDHLNTLFSRSNTGFPPTQMLYRWRLERKLKKNN